MKEIINIQEVAKLLGFTVDRVEDITRSGKLPCIKWSLYEDWNSDVLYSYSDVWHFIQSGRKSIVGIVWENRRADYILVQDHMIRRCGVHPDNVRIIKLTNLGVTAEVKSLIANITSVDTIIISPNVDLFPARSTWDMFECVCRSNNVEIVYALDSPYYGEVTDINKLVVGNPYLYRGNTVLLDRVDRGTVGISLLRHNIEPDVYLSDKEYYRNLIKKLGYEEVFCYDSKLCNILS